MNLQLHNVFKITRVSFLAHSVQTSEYGLIAQHDIRPHCVKQVSRYLAELLFKVGLNGTSAQC